MRMKKIEEEYVEYIKENLDENRKTGRAALQYLESSTAKYKGETIATRYMPKVFPADVVAYLKENIGVMYGILQKVVQRYMGHAEYRALFGFSERLEELILNFPGYANLLPMLRLDIFLNEEDLSFKFCEFNADGTSSMNEDRELNIALKLTSAYKELEKKYKLSSFELFDSWAAEFAKIYGTYEHKVERPYIAIVDFLEKGSSIEEFEQFKMAFERAGYEAEICEIRGLKFDGGHLCSESGRIINAVYRRAVTSDIFEHMAESAAFVEAVRKNKVCVIGNFCTHIVHDKILFYILNREETLAFLEPREREFVKEHIPYTVALNAETAVENHVIDNKDKWIIKPRDSYGAKNIYAGINMNDAEWAETVNSRLDSGYVLQEFITPYKSANIDFRGDDPQFTQYSNLTGIYVYNGKFKGFYSRQSMVNIISGYYNETVIPSVMAEGKVCKFEDTGI